MLFVMGDSIQGFFVRFGMMNFTFGVRFCLEERPEKVFVFSRHFGEGALTRCVMGDVVGGIALFVSVDGVNGRVPIGAVSW